MQDDYDNTVHYVRKRPQIIRTVNLRTVLAVLATVSFAVCLLVALLAVAPISRRFSVKGRTFYGLVTGTYEAEAQATAASAEIRKAGGSGYVYASAGGFNVLAAVYGAEKDADTVIARYPAAGYGKLTLSVAELRLPVYDDKADNKRVAALLRYPYTELYDGLYGLSVSLDKAEISESLMLYTVTGYKTQASKNREEVRGFLRERPADAALAGLESLYGQTLSLLDGILSGEGTPAVRLKAAVCDLVVRCTAAAEAIPAAV